MSSDVPIWFRKLTLGQQRQLVLDPARALPLGSELRRAIEDARERSVPGRRLSRDDAQWLEMRAFSERLSMLELSLVQESLPGRLAETDPDAYNALRRGVQTLHDEMQRLFHDQSAGISARWATERARGGDPYDMRED